MQCFKEWQIICEALQRGDQSVILRKGGIHEGKKGFSFGNVDEFLLFPTRFHAQGDLVQQDGTFTPGKEWEPGDEVTFHTLCKVVDTIELESWALVSKLAPFHLWSEDCIKDRFNWEGKGMASGSIHLAILRVYTLDSPITLNYHKGLGGCRSWVELEAISHHDTRGTAVIPDADFTSFLNDLKKALV